MLFLAIALVITLIFTIPSEKIEKCSRCGHAMRQMRTFYMCDNCSNTEYR